MRANAPVLLIAIAVGGFFTGTILNDLPGAQSLEVSNVIMRSFMSTDNNPLVKSALLYTPANGVIESAEIDFTIETFNVDDYLVNAISECIFESDQSIDGTILGDSEDDGICVVCRFTGESSEIVIAEGKKNLPLGYTANTPITISMLEDPNDPEPNDVRFIHGVQLEVQSAILDFSDLSEGDILKNQYKDKFGIEIQGYKKLGVDSYGNFIVSPLDLMIYDTDPPIGADPDLEVEIGNISIIPHDDDDNGIPDPEPNDSPDGGWQIFKFNPPRFVNSLVFVDHDRDNAPGMDVVIAYDNFDANGCTGNIIAGPVQIQNEGDGSKQTLVMMNAQKTSCLKVQYMDSGGVAKINLGCPLDSDTIDYGEPTPGGNPETIFFTDFDDYDGEENKWTKDNDRTTTNNESYISFGLGSSGSIGPHSNPKYLGGSGNFDNLNTGGTDWAAYNRQAIDISNYDDVIVSFWFSYEDTESADEFGFYYWDGSQWETIYEDFSPNIGSGQSPWVPIVYDQIPDDLDSLILQFRWETSSGSEHIMIDDLQVLGTPE